jgi:hypothetical protein
MFISGIRVQETFFSKNKNKNDTDYKNKKKKSSLSFDSILKEEERKLEVN